jgi:ubiquinone/menaquinone biosynthesis C-methylase UbiE
VSAVLSPEQYWEARAARFSRVAAGLPAVCSYGMPRLYNEAIHACQYRALAPHLAACRGCSILDVGCGVGRWTLRLARNGNRVVGVDLSPTMIEVARERAVRERLDCDFRVADVAQLALGTRFDAIFAVTVLQHVVADDQFDRSLRNLAQHLTPGGTMVLLEVAPTTPSPGCESQTFKSRPVERFVDGLRAAGLQTMSVTGVDIVPLRRVILPAMRRMPAFVGRALLTASTLLSLPLDLLASHRLTSLAWHKVIVARHAGDG